MNDGGGGGVVSTSYLPLVFEGNNSFLGNRGTSLTVSGPAKKECDNTPVQLVFPPFCFKGER